MNRSVRPRRPVVRPEVPHALTPLDTAGFPELVRMWRRLELGEDSVPSRDYARLGSRIIAIGEPLLGYDVVTTGLRQWPGDVRLRQLAGLALARAGATERAAALLGDLYREGHRDGETLGILARTHKDLWKHSDDARRRRDQLRLSERLYRKAYREACQCGVLDDAIYTGVNAATLSALEGANARSRRLAREVRSLCERRLARGEDYWAAASLAESVLLVGDLPTAQVLYGRASVLGRGQYANLLSSRQHARLLLRHLGQAENALDDCFPLPRVAVFSGHIIDGSGRLGARFREADVPEVARRLQEWMAAARIEIGYASAAAGGDILFLEALLARNGEANIVLPCPPEMFVQASVPGLRWRERFHRVLQGAARVMVLSPDLPKDSSVLHRYANLVLVGLAVLRAQLLETTIRPLAVWDGKRSTAPGGTYSFVALCRQLGRLPDVIKPRTKSRSGLERMRHVMPSVAAAFESQRLLPRVPGEQVVAILFADIAGYTHMSETAGTAVVSRLMGWVAERLRQSHRAVLSRNTWGDALHVVFKSVTEAGKFALALRDHARQHVGHPRSGEPLLRIGVHAGPARVVRDHLTGRRSFLGNQVNWAARIEPITVPGEVYASQPFAALAALEKCEFSCEYVGVVPLAKESGSFPLFCVRPSPGGPQR